MSKKLLPTLLITLLAGCSAIVNPSGAPFAEDGGVRPTDSGTDGFTPPRDSSTVDSGSGDSGRLDSGAVDSGASCPGGCDDGVSCTVDSCVGGVCRHEANDATCDDGISCTVDRCSATDDCINTPNDGLCDDGYCFTGARCDVGAGGCVGGSARDCRDGDACTADTCDAVAMMCVNDPRDDDGDGFAVARVSSGGFPPGGSRDCPGGDDCDDDNADIHPGATEVCNGVDDDCDGTIDEGCPTPPDDCGTAQAIALSAGRGSASGSFGALNNDYGTTCGSRRGGGRDAVYYVDVSSLSDITIDTLGSASDTVLSVTLDCPSFSSFGQNGCDDDIDEGTITDSRIWLHRVGPSLGSSTRRVFILVDGFDSGATGAYTVNVRVRDARADTCSEPIDISGGGTLIGAIAATSIGIGGQQGSCQTAAENFEAEAVASFHGSTGGSADFDAFARDFVPDLYVRSTCGRGDSELDCQKGGAVGGGFNEAQLGVDVTTGTPYFLFVDGAAAGGGYSVDYQP